MQMQRLSFQQLSVVTQNWIAFPPMRIAIGGVNERTNERGRKKMKSGKSASGTPEAVTTATQQTEQIRPLSGRRAASAVKDPDSC